MTDVSSQFTEDEEWEKINAEEFQHEIDRNGVSKIEEFFSGKTGEMARDISEYWDYW